jgi:2-polyprenyl-6-methoxyphenol hydroxylase-like FAD-dependent oxidoreductase
VYKWPLWAADLPDICWGNFSTRPALTPSFSNARPVTMCWVAERMHKEGLIHGGFDMLFKGERHRIDMNRLTGGKNVMVYGQTELTRDLMDARKAAGLTTIYEAGNVTVHDFDTAKPRVRYGEGRR